MIDFGKTIYSIITAGIPSGTTVNVYPLVAPEGSELPLVIFKRSFSNNYNKDYFTGSDLSIEVAILTLNYYQGVDLAMDIKNSFDNSNYQLISGVEQYAEGAYIQSLVFEAKIF